MAVNPLLTSVASGVEMSLAFSMSTKVVDTFVSLSRVPTMQWRSHAGFIFSDTDDRESLPSVLASGFILVFATGFCLAEVLYLLTSESDSVNETLRGVVAASASSTTESNDGTNGRSKLRVAADELASISRHVLILATTRIGLALLVVPEASQEQNAMLSMRATSSVNSDRFTTSQNDGWATPPVFSTAKSIIQVMFAAIFLSCASAVFVAQRSMEQQKEKAKRGTGMAASSLSAIVGNVQRTFAQQVSLLIPEPNARKVVVIFGMCLFPSVTNVLLQGVQPMSAAAAAAAVISGGKGRERNVISSDNARRARGQFSVVSFLVGSSPKNLLQGGARLLQGEDEDDENDESLGSRRRGAFFAFLKQAWLIAACTTWLNLAIEFILSSISVSSSSSGTEIANMGMTATWSIGFCILSKSLHPIVPGLQLFQGFIEWNVAMVLTTGIQQVGAYSSSTMSDRSGSDSPQHFLVMTSCSILFLVLDALIRDIARLQHQQPNKPPTNDVATSTESIHDGMLTMTKNASSVLYSISTIMLTNSLVAWSMDIVSASSYADSIDSPGSVGIGTTLCTIVVGVLVSQIMLHVVRLSETRTTSCAGNTT